MRGDGGRAARAPRLGGRTLCAACVAGRVRVGQLMCPTRRQPFLADEVRPNLTLRDPIAGVAAAAAAGPLAIDPARLTLLAAGGPKAGLLVKPVTTAGFVKNEETCQWDHLPRCHIDPSVHPTPSEVMQNDAVISTCVQ